MFPPEQTVDVFVGHFPWYPNEWHYCLDSFLVLIVDVFYEQFSDFLVYTSRVASSVLQFKVHGQLPLRGMIVRSGSFLLAMCLL